MARMPYLALVAVVVADYDEAIAWYTGVLGFRLVEDTPLDEPGKPGKRWVVVAPPGADPARGQTAILLARAGDERQRERVGDQTGGRVWLFLRTDDFARDHGRLTAAGVAFVRPPRDEPYGTVAVFADLYGNLWDLVGPPP
jgi:catechol 2,3-dioxygenase-like lactoylglutathione lyase family enzyme